MFWGSECLCVCAALICSWCVNQVLWTAECVNIRSAFITPRSLSFSQFTLVLIMFLLWACAAGASFEPKWPPQQQLCHSGLTRGSFERWPFCGRINPCRLDKWRAVTFDLTPRRGKTRAFLDVKTCDQVFDLETLLNISFSEKRARCVTLSNRK